eukprot:760071-Hanusia_phi.AAC.4
MHPPPSWPFSHPSSPTFLPSSLPSPPLSSSSCTLRLYFTSTPRSSSTTIAFSHPRKLVTRSCLSADFTMYSLCILLLLLTVGQVHVNGFRRDGAPVFRLSYEGPDTGGLPSPLNSIAPRAPQLPRPSQWLVRVYRSRSFPPGHSYPSDSPSVNCSRCPARQLGWSWREKPSCTTSTSRVWKSCTR